MPLPPALAAKLAKRGILKDASVEGFDPVLGRVVPNNKGRDSYNRSHQQQQHHQHEEVFAEDYDDTADTGPPMPLQPKSIESDNTPGSIPLPSDNTTATTNLIDKTKFIGHSGCPNKWNIHHECVLFCRTHWGVGIKEPEDTEYIRVHNQMVEKYHPLPDGWREMYDAGTGRHYYWCTKTDKVSWFPPGHPKSKPTEAASKVREQLSIEAATRRDMELQEDKMSLDSDDTSEDEAEEDRRLQEKRKREKEKRKEEEKKLKEKRKKKEEEALDPMDPAAYSDVPRGTWSTGLPDQATAKSGVDGTASGPLFQQRPYPNPGAVLRANAAARAELEDED